MPKSTKKSPLAEKFKNTRQVFENRLEKGAEVGGSQRLPAGINNGIAELTSCYFGSNENGDYWRASGVVINPTHINTESGEEKIEGRHTSILEPMDETPNRARKTFEEHLDRVLNELMLLGVQRDELDFDTLMEQYGDVQEGLEKIMEALVESRVQFKFDTWNFTPPDRDEPLLIEKWRGAIEGHITPTKDDEVEDRTESAQTADSQPAADPNPPFGDELDMLVNKADDEQDEDAQGQITKKAIDAGISEEFVEQAEKWEEVVEAIRAKEKESKKPAAAKKKTAKKKATKKKAKGGAKKEPGEFVPDVGDVYFVKLSALEDFDELGSQADEGNEESQTRLSTLGDQLDVPDEYDLYSEWATEIAKKATQAKPVECEITSVDKDGKTCGVKELDTQATFDGIDFDSIEQG